MTNLEDELRSAFRIQAQALPVPERPAVDRSIVGPSQQPRHRWLIAAACLVLIAVGVVALTLRPGGDSEPAPAVDSVVPDRTDPAPPVTTVVPEVTAPTSVVNGWVAVDAVVDVGRDIYLVRPGEAARRLEVAGSDTGDKACPAWSPDGTRLLFGRLTPPSDGEAGFDAELVIVPIAQDGMPGDPTAIGLDGFEIVGGFEGQPCGIWASDGRWVAFGGGGEVWVVDTQTGEIRRLPDLRPSDLEWRPGTDQLAIAGDMGTSREAPTLSTPVSIYTVSTGDLVNSALSMPQSSRGHLTAQRWATKAARTDQASSGSSTPTAPTIGCSSAAARRFTASVPCGPRSVTASPTNAPSAGNATRSSS